MYDRYRRKIYTATELTLYERYNKGSLSAAGKGTVELNTTA